MKERDDVAAALGTNPAAPSARQQEWGAVISIVVILAMVVLGAVYSWQNRVAEPVPTTINP